MGKLTPNEFIKFLKYYDNYYDTITEVSRPIIKNKKTNKEEKGESIFINSFRLYSLDDIKHNCRLFKRNFPKSTDGIWYKFNSKGEFVIILIEFKGVSFNQNDSKSVLENITSKINKIKEDDDCPRTIQTKLEYDDVLDNIKLVENRYGDSLEYGLYLKQFETIYLTIPTIYKEYCQKNPDVKEKDIDAFLKESKICVFVCVESFSRNQTEDNLDSLGNKFNNFAKKLKKGGVIDESMIFTKYDLDRLVEKLT